MDTEIQTAEAAFEAAKAADEAASTDHDAAYARAAEAAVRKKAFAVAVAAIEGTSHRAERKMRDLLLAAELAEIDASDERHRAFDAWSDARRRRHAAFDAMMRARQEARLAGRISAVDAIRLEARV